MKEGSIERGKKWKEKMELLEFRGLPQDITDLEWMKTQPAIMEDIQNYTDSLPKEKPIKLKKEK
jgi:hypothetical protein